MACRPRSRSCRLSRALTILVAYSRAHASGIWQFIPSTGKFYGLQQTFWYDGRRDVMAATGAALDYLQKLYEMFGSWDLALASYNWGEGAVGRAIAKNAAAGLSNRLSEPSAPRRDPELRPEAAGGEEPRCLSRALRGELRRISRTSAYFTAVSTRAPHGRGGCGTARGNHPVGIPVAQSCLQPARRHARMATGSCWYPWKERDLNSRRISKATAIRS